MLECRLSHCFRNVFLLPSALPIVRGQSANDADSVAGTVSGHCAQGESEEIAQFRLGGAIHESEVPDRYGQLEASGSRTSGIDEQDSIALDHARLVRVT